MLEFLEPSTMAQILEKYFEGKHILNTMGLSVPIADKTVYTQNIHRDVRTFTGSSKLWLNT